MATIDEQRQAFLDAIKDDPRDETTHRVFADWLEEHGFDDEAQFHRDWTAEKYAAAEAFFAKYPDEDLYRTGEQVIEVARIYLETGRSAENDWSKRVDRSPEKSAEFWAHYAILTGLPLPQDKNLVVPFYGCCQWSGNESTPSTVRGDEHLWDHKAYED